MAILEALACGLPVIATTACHFPELVVATPGSSSSRTSQAVTRSSSRACWSDLPRSDAEMAGEAGDSSRATTPGTRQGRRLAEVYRWLVSGGEAPEAVEMAGGF